MAIIFRSPCESSGDFTATTGTGITFGSSNNGYTGGSIRIGYTGSFNGQFVNKTLSTPSDIVQVRFNIATAATMNGSDDAVLLTLFDNTSYGTPVGQVRALGSGAGFSLRIVDPSNSYAGDYSNATVFTKNEYHTLTVKRNAGSIVVYLDVSATPILTYTFTQTGTTFPAFSVGNFYSASGAISGNVDFDDVFCKTTNVVSTEDEKVSDAIEGNVQKYHSASGAIIRPIDPVGGVTTPDSVSEGLAYALKDYVQSPASFGSMRTYFDETFVWHYNNTRRGSAPALAATTNTPTNAFYLYTYKYDGATQTVADGNWAGDADHEIAQALLWAHDRWGSAGTVNYLARANEILGDLRTYAFRLSSGTGYYYLMNDSFQTGSTVQLGGDYDNPAAYRLFAQYDTSNAAFWLSAAQGAYDFQTKAANYIFSPQVATAKLTPNWAAMTLSTAAISGTSTYGDSAWGYNSFRFYARAYDDYRWYGTTAVATLFALPKPFLASEYAANPGIWAEYHHDGTDKGVYESSLFYYPYYFVLYTGDTGNTTAASIASAKFPSYTVHPGGGYFGAPGYFGDMWMPIYRMQVAGTYLNYGQAVASTAGLLIMF